MESNNNSATNSTKSATTGNRFSKRPWLAGLIVSVILLILLEGICQVALLFRDKILVNQVLSPEEMHTQQLQAQDSIDRELLTKEMKYLYQDGIEFHPYRWYRLAGNFRGEYIQTDALGFRFRPEDADTSKKLIGLYGCSTMFSIYTKQEGTIPDLMNSDKMIPDDFRALNMGVGAYGSSTELAAFMESSRKYPLKYAVFLDGVNEVARYLDRFMYHKDEAFYDYWVYPYNSALQLAFMNTLNSRSSEYTMQKKTNWKPALYWVSVSIAGKIRNLLHLNNSAASSVAGNTKEGWQASDYEEAGRIAAKIYLENIRDIDAIAKSRGVQAYFVIQPSLFTTKRELKPIEQSIRDNNHPFLAAIHESTYRHIREADKTGLNFIDLSDAWDDLPPGEYFYDWHHVNKAGNRHLARKIAEKMNLVN